MVRHLFARRSLSQSINKVPALRQHRKRPLRFERLEARAMLSVNGDFNGDGFDDLAVGAPSENVNGIESGAVSVIYGGRKGLTSTGNQFWHENVPGVDGVAADADQFGSALAVGDFNGDGFDELAIGVPHKDVSDQGDAGAVNVLYGSSSGLRATGDQLWTQDSPGINDSAEFIDRFGDALAAGDFNGDGRDDLAIGMPESVGLITFAGAVNVIYGSASGLTNSGDQFWHQDSTGVADEAESVDQFGHDLAAGDFNGDGRDDLAIGVPFESVGAIANAGRVIFLYGSAAKLQTSGGIKQLSADSLGFASSASATFFGRGLAAGDFDGDGRDDLAIGAAGETVSGQAGAGAVYVAYGSSDPRQATAGAQRWQQTDLGGTPSTDDGFGFALATGDYDGDGRADLAIGAQKDDVVSASDNAGVVFMIYAYGLIDPKNSLWNQNLLSASNGAQMNDNFGAALG